MMFDLSQAWRMVYQTEQHRRETDERLGQLAARVARRRRLSRLWNRAAPR
jgi:hypothetical protein